MSCNEDVLVGWLHVLRIEQSKMHSVRFAPGASGGDACLVLCFLRNFSRGWKTNLFTSNLYL